MKTRLAQVGLSIALAAAVAPASLFAQSGGVKWVPAQAGLAPPDAIGAGPNPASPIPLVCRAKHKGSTIPGEVTPQGCAVATADGPVVSGDYEVPVGQKSYEWKPSSGGSLLPPAAIAGGREGKTAVFVCRAVVQGTTHVGRVRRDGCLFVAGPEQLATAGTYDVLSALEAKSAQADAANFARRGATPPPECAKGVASVQSLWPANHKMQMVVIHGVPDPKILSVHQDECVNGQGDGDTSPDAEIAGDRRSVMIRAERSGKGDGRFYHIRFSCAGIGEGVAKVSVAKNQNDPAVDQGPIYDSTTLTSPGCGGPEPTPTPTPTGECKDARPSVSSLWPPNHKMSDVTITGLSTEYRITAVLQDECVDGLGDGDTAPDAIISGDARTVQLRGERAGGGDGRVYHIRFTCGASGHGEVTVGVPKNQNDSAVDGGALYDSTLTTTPGCGAGPTPTPTPTGNCGAAQASVASLWPPNHKTVSVTVVGAGAYRIRSVMQDECVNGLGDGDTSPDAMISGDGQSVELRAERAGGANGRVYTITFECGSGVGQVKVSVPPNQSSAAVDDGPRYDSTALANPGCGGAQPTPTPVATPTAPPPGGCGGASASIAELWPPNHKMETISIQGVTGARITGVLQDECVDGLGDGDTAPDAVVAPDGLSVQLRSERSGTGDGRVYHVRFATSTCQGEVLVKVPHSQGGAPAGDGGPLYDSRASTTAGTNCVAVDKDKK